MAPKLKMDFYFVSLIALSCVFSPAAWAQSNVPPPEPPREEEESSAQPSPGAQGQQAVPGSEQRAPAPAAPLLEIKRLESESPVYSIELRDVELADLFRVIAHDYNLNILVDKEVQGTLSASFTNISLEDALEAIADMSNLALEKKKSVIKVVPNLITKTVVMRFLEAKKVLETSSTSAETSGTDSGSAAASASASTTASSATTDTTGSETSSTSSPQANTIFDLLSDKGKLFLGKQPNSIIIMDYPSHVVKIEQYLALIDQRMSTRVFKLKYLNARDVVGDAASSSNLGAVAAESSSDSSTSSSSSSAN